MDISKSLLEDIMYEALGMGLVSKLGSMSLPGGMAAAGAGIGAVSGAAKWANQRLQLRREKSRCGDNAACRAAVDRKIQSLNAGSLSGAVGRAAVGAAVGGAVGGAGKIAGFSGTPTSVYKAGEVAWNRGEGVGGVAKSAFNKAKEVLPDKVSAAPGTIRSNIGRFFKGVTPDPAEERENIRTSPI